MVAQLDKKFLSAFYATRSSAVSVYCSLSADPTAACQQTLLQADQISPHSATFTSTNPIYDHSPSHQNPFLPTFLLSAHFTVFI